MVEEIVVGDVDEELRAGRMRVHGTSHGDAADLVGQAVVGFVLDRRAGGLLLHARLETAALDHEVVDHAVEDGVVVVATFHVLAKFAAVSGAFSSSSFRVMTPWLVCSLIMWVIRFVVKIEGLSGVDSFGYDKRFDLPGLPWSGESMTKDPMSKPETTAAPNFLRQIVQADLDAGKRESSPVSPEPNGYLHIGRQVDLPELRPGPGIRWRLPSALR